MQPIKTAVFPAAGLGTRFLPITKSMPKEMLPVIDKPIIQYAVDEAVQAGVSRLIFVTSHTKRSLEDYFDSNYELESRLQAANKSNALAEIQSILPKHVQCIYIRQKEPAGLGDAILQVKDVVGEQPFAVLLPDDIIACEKASCLQQMIDHYQKVKHSILAVQSVPSSDVSKYGIVKVSDENNVIDIVEKPSLAEAPSTLASIGRYILTPGIFACLEQVITGKGGEIQLTDAIALLLRSQLVSALPVQGTRYDCGDKLGWLKAVIEFALRQDEFQHDLTNFLKARGI